MIKSNDVMTVVYKKPFSDYILGIIDSHKLYNNNKLLLNLEKVIPVSKILKGRKNKLINGIDYEKKDEKLIFHLYF